jgi:methylthioribose-1-phosphate isomerase
MPIPTIKWEKKRVKIIDQSLLPHKTKFIYCNSAESVWKAVREMKIRGAPALGVIAAYGVYLGVRGSGKGFFRDLRRTVKYLSTSRPTARNLFWALERMEGIALANKQRPVDELKKILLKEAGKILKEDKEICRKMGKFGSRLIEKGPSCRARALRRGNSCARG